MTNEQEVIVAQAIKIHYLEKTAMGVEVALSKAIQQNEHHMTMREQQDSIITTLQGRLKS